MGGEVGSVRYEGHSTLEEQASAPPLRLPPLEMLPAAKAVARSAMSVDLGVLANDKVETAAAPVVAIQQGHCFRTRGATGTTGPRGTEQAFVSQLAQLVAAEAVQRGYTIKLLLADPTAYPTCDVFVAFHQDGSNSPSVRGASVGYPPGRSVAQRYASIWKRLYESAGWTGGFRADNYSAGLRGYYAYRRVVPSSGVEVVIEHGFATNAADAAWMWDNIKLISKIHVDTFDAWFGRTTTAPDYEFVPGGLLGVGDTGPLVRELQELLFVISEFHPSVPSPGRADGDFGPLTSASLAAVQSWVGTTPDGVWGPKTAAALEVRLAYLDAIARPAPPVVPIEPEPVDALSPAARAEVKDIVRAELARLKV